MKQKFYNFDTFPEFTQFIQNGLNQKKFRVVSMVASPKYLKMGYLFSCEYGVIVEFVDEIEVNI
jgi:hypothetical protein